MAWILRTLFNVDELKVYGDKEQYSMYMETQY